MFPLQLLFSMILLLKLVPHMFAKDLDLHLKAFGNVSHLRLWRCIHVLLEEDCYDAGVDNHGEWYRRNRSIHPNTVRICRKLVSEHERSECE
jgi:hypothetical protein